MHFLYLKGHLKFFNCLYNILNYKNYSLWLEQIQPLNSSQILSFEREIFISTILLSHAFLIKKGRKWGIKWEFLGKNWGIF
ncbi:hypothetical protein C4Z92_14540 [Clostridioides difficile]|nr:hypothetical protein [Clostridioides difficile]EGT4153555.1 hypothetical protein [Clostridioides difficile]EGT4680408.1 hypothetical protein [Clostridioides difficile]EGT4760479.1 hypothetical protein [Clostridioides difficile]EGT4791509.1 hypothetical protein [Clostridioides difficile]